jgi:hypothetical protein
VTTFPSNRNGIRYQWKLLRLPHQNQVRTLLTRNDHATTNFLHSVGHIECDPLKR